MDNQQPYTEFSMDPGLQLAEIGPWPHQFRDTPGGDTGADQHHQQHDWACPKFQLGVAGLGPPRLPGILDTEAKDFLWSHELRDAQTPAVETVADKRYQQRDWASPKLLPEVRIISHARVSESFKKKIIFNTAQVSVYTMLGMPYFKTAPQKSISRGSVKAKLLNNFKLGIACLSWPRLIFLWWLVGWWSCV